MPCFGFVASLPVFSCSSRPASLAHSWRSTSRPADGNEVRLDAGGEAGAAPAATRGGGLQRALGAAGGRGGKRGAERRLVRTTVAEVALGGPVFVAAAMLTQTTVSKSIPDAPEAKAFEGTAQANDLSVALGIDPNRTGLNTYTVRSSPGDKRWQQRGAADVPVSRRHDRRAGIAGAAAGVRSGDLVGQGPYLTLEGQWRVETEVRRANVDDATAFFDVRPAGSAATSVRRGGGGTTRRPAELERIRRLRHPAGRAGFAIGGQAGASREATRLVEQRHDHALLRRGRALLFGVHRDAATPADQLKNPVFPDQNSITTGRTLFQENCASCHGQRGIPPRPRP